RYRGRKRRQRWPEIAPEHTPPKCQILLDERSLETIKLGQSLAHQFDRTRIGRPKIGHQRHGLLDRIDRRHRGDEKSQRHAQKDYEKKLEQALGKIFGKAVHMLSAL